MFQSLGLHRDLERAVAALGFEKPTPIQESAIPAVLAGRDVAACATTGTGKTAAFLLPLMSRFLTSPRPGMRALVLTPTRELAAQIDEHFRSLGGRGKLRSAAVYGGVAMGPQRDALRRGVDVLVATPGRLLDHLQYPYACIDTIETLVLDEADRMLDMGFLPAIRQILRRVPKQRQTLLFSATMPAQIVGLSRELLRDPVSIDLARKSTPATTIRQALFTTPSEQKKEVLVSLLGRGEVESALVFTRTKHRADRLSRFLTQSGIESAALHGDRTQAQRTRALDGFRSGRTRVLVATDVAARGIDVAALSHVINFDVPQQPEDYIHRVGRTGRAEATGDAWTLVSPEEEGAVRDLERAIGRKLPREVAVAAETPRVDASAVAARNGAPGVNGLLERALAARPALPRTAGPEPAGGSRPGANQRRRARRRQSGALAGASAYGA